MIPYSDLETLRGIEQLAGSLGYQKYLDSPCTIPNYSLTNSDIIVFGEKDLNFPINIFASGYLRSLTLYTKLRITAGGYTGVYHVWGGASRSRIYQKVVVPSLGSIDGC